MRMFGYYFSAGIALAIGLGLVVCGVGCIIAGADEAHRLRPVIGLALSVAGGAALVAGARTVLQPFRSPHPEILAVRIIRLARAFGGEVPFTRIVSGLRVPEQHARAALECLVGDEVCRREERGGEEWYVFPSMARQ